MKSQIFRTLFLLTLLFPINLIAMEMPELKDYETSREMNIERELKSTNNAISNYNFTNLDPELKAYILRIGVISIIKDNDIFKPFNNVINFLCLFRLLNRECRDVVDGINENIPQITFQDIKSIAKQNFVDKEFKDLTRQELNENLELIFYTIDEFDSLMKNREKLWERLELLSIKDTEDSFLNLTKKAAKVIIAGAYVNKQIFFKGLFTSPWQIPILSFCILAKCNNLIDLLISYGADVNLLSKDGMPPLIFAIRHNECSIAKKLLLANASLNNFYGFRKNAYTPLMFGVIDEKETLVKLILEFKPDITLKTSQGHTALDLACINTCKGLWSPTSEPLRNIIKLLENYQKNLKNEECSQSWCIAS